MEAKLEGAMYHLEHYKQVLVSVDQFGKISRIRIVTPDEPKENALTLTEPIIPLQDVVNAFKIGSMLLTINSEPGMATIVTTVGRTTIPYLVDLLP